MMQPMSYRRRMVFFISFVLLFIVLIPVVLLYSLGYRLGKDLSIAKTGGIFISYGKAGASIYVDNVLKEQTSLFQRGKFLENMKAGDYNVRFDLDGYISWNKIITVEDAKVAEGYPYLIKKEISTTSILKYDGVIEEGEGIVNEDFAKADALFEAPTTTVSTKYKIKVHAPTSTIAYTGSSTTIVSAPTSTIIATKGDIQLLKTETSIDAYYTGDLNAAPFTFCLQKVCLNEIRLLATSSISHVEFLFNRNDVILYSTKDGIYVTEFDARSPRNTHKLINGNNLDFRTFDGTHIVVKDGTEYYNAEII